MAVTAAKTTRPNDEVIVRDCIKCRGTGQINAYAHVLGGMCFDCNGAGKFTTTVGKEKARNARAARADQKRKDEAHARWEADVRSRKAAGQTYADWHADCCLCGKPEGCNEETKRMFDAVV